MSGEASWLTLAIMLGGALFVIGLVVAAFASNGFRRVQRSVECPGTSHPASLVALESQTSGRPADVLRCSELHGQVTCNRACLNQLEPQKSS